MHVWPSVELLCGSCGNLVQSKSVKGEFGQLEVKCHNMDCKEYDVPGTVQMAPLPVTPTVAPGVTV